MDCSNANVRYPISIGDQAQVRRADPRTHPALASLSAQGHRVGGLPVPGDSAGLSASALSKQLTTLEDAGYVQIRNGFVGKRLTSVARAAFDQHDAALQEIVAKAGPSVLPST